MYRLLGLTFVCLAAAAHAAPLRLEISPAGSQVAMRAYGLGLLPLDGQFSRFHGWLTYDPDDHASCSVDLTVEVASLAMLDASTRDTIVGPDFMDAPRHPQLVYVGSCQPLGLSGMLDLHGVNRRFDLSLSWVTDRVIATGDLHRADWGMTAMSFLAGPTVRISVSVALPGPAHASRER